MKMARRRLSQLCGIRIIAVAAFSGWPGLSPALQSLVRHTQQRRPGFAKNYLHEQGSIQALQLFQELLVGNLIVMDGTVCALPLKPFTPCEQSLLKAIEKYAGMACAKLELQTSLGSVQSLRLQNNS